MQKNKWLLICILTLVYSALFFDHNSGLNFLIFSLLFVVSIVWLEPDLLKNKITLFTGLTCIFSSAMLVFHPTDLAIVCNVFSLALFSVSALLPSSSVLIKLITSVFSLVGAFVFIMLEATEHFSKRKTDQSKKTGQKLLFYLLAVVLILVFISIYQNINPLFKKYTEQLNLDFITLRWIMFTLGGLLLMYGTIKSRVAPGLVEWEHKSETPFNSETAPTFDKGKKPVFTFLFVALNVLLVLITLLDINYLYLGKGLPEGITHKQFVHNGVGMLMFSILLGVGLILYLFRGSLNFDTGNKIIKYLVYAWLLQNLIMVISTAMRNYVYITEALLTYKRIGVYYWLALAAAGLISTIVKINKLKRSWYLVRSTTFFAYFLLIGSSAIDWDQYISNYNFSKIKDIAGLDKRYLINLSEGNLKQLYLIKNHPKFEIDSVYHYRYSYGTRNKEALDRKLYRFLEKNRNEDLRSYNRRTERVKQDIEWLNNHQLIDTISLDYYYADLRYLAPLTHLKVLQIPHLNIKDTLVISSINKLRSLETLKLRMSDMKDSLELYKLKHIKTLYLDVDSKKDSVLALRLHLPYNLKVRSRGSF